MNCLLIFLINLANSAEDIQLQHLKVTNEDFQEEQPKNEMQLTDIASENEKEEENSIHEAHLTEPDDDDDGVLEEQDDGGILEEQDDGEGNEDSNDKAVNQYRRRRRGVCRRGGLAN